MLSRGFFIVSFLIGLPVLLGGLAFYIAKDVASKSSSVALKAQVSNVLDINSNSGLIPLSLAPSAEYRKINFIPPTDGFLDRITKKPYGIFITPQTSPVQPDKFTGFHNAIDIEYGDTTEDVPVRAIANGTIILSKYASGYGGVIVIKHEINGQLLLALYGHLDPEQMLPGGTNVTLGQKIGILGEGHTQETDGARKHLHFSIMPYNPENKLDIRGYVNTEEDLSKWIDPLIFFK